MRWSIRGLFPYLFLLFFFVALFLALRMGSLPPAEFTFANGTEIQTVDPAKSSGVPEGRIIDSIFEGLYRKLPDPHDPEQMIPLPALATSHDLSEDLKTYTFHIRQGVQWTNGDPVTSYDWTFSWLRFLHPESRSQYAYQLWYVKNAKKYTTVELAEGDKVEIELADRPDEAQMFPRGTMISGILKKIDKFEEKLTGKFNGEDVEPVMLTWLVYTVDCVPEKEGKPDWDGPLTQRVFYVKGTPSQFLKDFPDAEAAMHVLYHFSQVGIRALDSKTLEIELESPTPYFLELASFYPMHPVNRTCVEQYGYPNWTKPENIVTVGPYEIKERRIRDRIRLEKSPTYWDADNVHLKTIDALAVQSDTTQLNMYMSGQLDWATTVPNSALDELRLLDVKKHKNPERKDERDDLLMAPMLSTYFYRVNTTRPPLDNPKVRRALSLAINKQEIVDHVTRGGQIPAGSLVPPGVVGYDGPDAEVYNPEKAKELLAEAGFPDGKGMRPIEILYNTNEGHRSIAEVIQQQWKKTLHIEVKLRNVEWGVYLTMQRELDYDVCRAGWIGDYPDPNTFLDMFVSGGENNETGWSNKAYDKLIEEASTEPDPQKRFSILKDSEEILVEEMPILPVYFYVSVNMVRPYIKNFYPNLQDLHPMHVLEIDEALREDIRKWEDLE
ncbi:peptide ABC transporter substrate-binding protein [bacterium]|nr:peptide ABC transporter substrate-binding protein [bacterium]